MLSGSECVLGMLSILRLIGAHLYVCKLLCAGLLAALVVMLFSVCGCVCVCCLEVVLLFNFRSFAVGGCCLSFDSCWSFLVVGQLNAKGQKDDF